MMVVVLGHKKEMVYKRDRRLQARVGNGARPWPCVPSLAVLFVLRGTQSEFGPVGSRYGLLRGFSIG